MIVATFDPVTRRYVVPATEEYASMSFAHPMAAARAGIVIAGELPPSQPQVSPPMNTGATMKTIRNVLAALSIFLVAACDQPCPNTSTSATESGADTDESSGSSSTGGGWTCPEIGAACNLSGNDCAEGLRCDPIDFEDPNNIAGVCVVPCGKGCAVGKCNKSGFCADADGLPTGLCGGLPQCASDPCIDACDNGLDCVAGYCGIGCKSLEDCPAGTALCFTSGGSQPGVCFGYDGQFVDVCE